MSETAWRLSVFVGVLILMVLWEYVSPKRRSRYSRKQRWPANLGIVVIDTVLLRIIAPIGLTGVAVWAENNGWGVLKIPFTRD
jgi:hypothetical protein